MFMDIVKHLVFIIFWGWGGDPRYTLLFHTVVCIRIFIKLVTHGEELVPDHKIQEPFNMFV